MSIEGISDIRVFGEYELLALVRQGEALGDHLISIGNPRLPWSPVQPGERLQPLFRRRFRRILRLSFFDLEPKDFPSELHPRRTPERRDVRRAIRFYGATRGRASGYVLHCWAGISRSTAMALGLLYLETGSEEVAARRLREIRPEARPHPGILRLFDEELGSRLSEAAEWIMAESLAELRQELEALSSQYFEELPAAE